MVSFWPSNIVVLLVLAHMSKAVVFTIFDGDVITNRSFGEVRSVLNRDAKYGRWSSSRIPYRIDQNYSPFQKTAIREAMTQIQTDVANCIRFTEYDSSSDLGEDFINISPTEEGVLRSTCSTAPGRALGQRGKGQPMVMFSGSGGCMDNKRDIMKVLANVLGLRNEFSRPDRDSHLHIQPQNFRSEFKSLDLYRKYQPSEVEYQNFPFDYQSITMYSMDRFAIPGTVAYNLVTPNVFIGNLPRLSKGDCQGLAAHYGCDATFCTDPYDTTSLEAKIREREKDKSKSVGFPTSSWTLEDLAHLDFAKDLFQKPKGSSRRPFLIRPFAIL